jgi:uncharacterized membrane protein YfcA
MLIVAVSSALGAYTGASIAYKIEDQWVVWAIVTTGFFSFLYFI